MSPFTSFQQFLVQVAGGEWAAKATLGSVVRTFAWATLFFWLIGQVISPEPLNPLKYTYAPDLKGTVAFPMASPKSDPRGFRRDIPPKSPDKFRVGWVGGSSLLARSTHERQKKRSFLPLEVMERLSTIEGKQPEVALYMFSAIRIFDSYLCMLDAIDRECDLIVITLNPVWSINPKATSLWTNLYSGVVPAALGDPGTIGLISLLGGPRQLAEGAIASFFDTALNRYDARAAINKFSFFSLDTNRILKKTSEELRYQTLFPKHQPLEFWIRHEKWGGKNKKLSSSEWQNAAISYSAEKSGTLSQAIIEKMVKRLKEADIPSLIYVAPIRYDFLEKEESKAKIVYLEKILETLKERYAGSNVHIVSQNPSRLIDGLIFGDIVHLKRMENLSDFLAGQISTLANKNSKVAQSKQHDLKK